MDEFIIFCAKNLWLLVALGAAAAVVCNKERRLTLGLVALIALPLAYALARAAGMLFAHPQPFAALGFEPLVPHEVDNSFPSDHTLIAGVFASVAFLADKRFGLVLWALTLLVGTARVAAGLHWPVDIAAAALVAAGAVWVAHRGLLFLKVY